MIDIEKEGATKKVIEIINTEDWGNYWTCRCLNCDTNQESDDIKKIKIYKDNLGGIDFNLCKNCRNLRKDLLSQ